MISLKEQIKYQQISEELKNNDSFNWTELLKHGTISEDISASAIVGKEGWIYIFQGSNNYMDYYTGKKQISQAILDQWKNLLEQRLNWHRERNIKYLHFFVPSKVAVYPEYYPYPLNTPSESPIFQLQKVCNELFLYPIDALIYNKDIFKIYDKHNSHWTFWACYLSYELICQKIGIIPNEQILDFPIEIVKEKGNMALKFGVDKAETIIQKKANFNGHIVYDNQLIKYGHQGSIRILKNDSATPGKMIIFGDSFCNPGFPDYSDNKRYIHRFTSLFAETISEVHFVWSPRIDYQYIEREKPDFVLTEMAERFLVKVPDDNFQLTIEEYAKQRLEEYENKEKITSTSMTKKEILKKAKAFIEEGNALKEQNNLAASIQSYQQAIKIKPDYVQPWLKLANSYESQENWQEAIKCYQISIGLMPNNSSIYLKLARALLKQDKIHGAIEAYQNAIEIKPDLPSIVYKELGDLLSQKKDDLEKAIAIYRKASELKSDWNVGFNIKFADTLMKNKQIDEAIQWYEKALELKPESAKINIALGNVFFQKEDFDRAINCYQKAIQLRVNSVTAYKKIGDIYKLKGQLDLALEYYRKFLNLKPDATYVYQILGDILSQQGLIAEAKQYYERASKK